MSRYQFFYIDPQGFEYALTDGVATFLKRDGMAGFGMIRAEGVTQRTPYRDGATLLGTVYTPIREMQLGIDVQKSTHAEVVALIRSLTANANPYKDSDALGHLRIQTPDGAERYIACWLVEVTDPEWDGPFFCTLILTFWAPDPFFYDPTQETETFGLDNPGGIAFPIEFPAVFSESDVDSTVVVYNTGDVLTWPTVRINGPGTDPIVENETVGKTVTIDQTLESGDYIDIDMENATISFYDASVPSTTNIIENMDASSEFWHLQQGGNSIHVEMTDVTTGSIVLSYYLRYLCV